MGSDEPRHAFVGDVQGCADELDELLGRLEDELGTDYRLHCVGDLVNRGPYNLRALERMRELVESDRAAYVLGNHEINLISVFLGLRDPSARDTLGDVLESREALDWVEWLRRRPLCEAGDLEGQRYVMVHASVHPDWDVEECQRRAKRASTRLSDPDIERCREFLREDPEPGTGRDDLARLVSCRSVTASGWSSEEPEPGISQPWHQAWRERNHDYGVVYGHWARQGLNVEPGLRGLDTGCVHHRRDLPGQLTAWLPAVDADPSVRGPFGLPDRGFVQIPARHEYGRVREPAVPL